MRIERDALLFCFNLSLQNPQKLKQRTLGTENGDSRKLDFALFLAPPFDLKKF